jgi:MFS family permease
VGGLLLGAGYLAAARTESLLGFALAQGLLIGLGCSASFGPLMTDISFWFERRRGLAVSLVASGNYLSGVVWPPVVQHFVQTHGWRATYNGVGIVSAGLMVVLALAMRTRRARPVAATSSPGSVSAAKRDRPLGVSPAMLQALLCVAGVACCVAMSMPQVHIVAYCSDLGFGAARGAQMLSVMLAFGVVSRLLSGLIADRIGGVRTLLLGSALQGLALLLYLPFDGLGSLFVISALFGLFQGGIVPSYALIVREFFSPDQAAARVGAVLFATLIGMALGGWVSGKIFDLTGSYAAAFVHGLAWNALNLSIVVWLIVRSRRARGPVEPAALAV